MIGLLFTVGFQQLLAKFIWNVDFLRCIGQNKAINDILELGLERVESDTFFMI